MRRYSPPYYSPPRRGYGGRPRNPPRRGYGGDRGSRRHKDQNHGSLLVRNIPLDCRAEELRVPFERFVLVRDVYLPKDYYTGEPRGFAFVQFVDPYDAAEAQYHMNGKIVAGREISVVLAAETRKRPEEMRRKSRTGRGPASYGERQSSYYGYSHSRSPPRYASGSRSRHRSRSYSPAPRHQSNYSISPERRHAEHPRSPRNHPREQDFLHNRRSYSPGYDNIPGQNYDKHSLSRNADQKTEEEQTHWRSPPGRASRSPSGSRSRSADISPRRNI